jgi:uncharacterized protein (TIGR04255 family)
VTKSAQFSNPPLVEMVVSVLFTTGYRHLKSAELGLFWSEINSDFPKIEEAAPLPPQIETPQRLNKPEINFSNLPPARRTILLSTDGRSLIQIQPDRFIFNWRKVEKGDRYPSYEEVALKFEKFFKIFRTFLAKIGINSFTYKQLELNYVNHIDDDNGLRDVGIGGVLVDHNITHEAGTLLSKPCNYSWTTTYDLPGGEGRLHIMGQQAMLPPKPETFFRLVISSRGIPSEPTDENMKKWFTMAHANITQAFICGTSKKLQKEYWGKP